jgi:hypothetical protein
MRLPLFFRNMLHRVYPFEDAHAMDIGEVPVIANNNEESWRKACHHPDIRQTNQSIVSMIQKPIFCPE